MQIKNRYRALSGNGNAGNWGNSKIKALAEVRSFQALGYSAELEIEFPDGDRKKQFVPKTINLPAQGGIGETE